jgi:hypothetical protein
MSGPITDRGMELLDDPDLEPDDDGIEPDWEQIAADREERRR